MIGTQLFFIDTILKTFRALCSIWYSVVLYLPFSRLRINYYNMKGCRIHRMSSISPNVRIRGKFEMNEGSSLAQNCSISGESAGVFIGKQVMIAPNVVIVAFNHGFEDPYVPMVKQGNSEAPVIIEDNVWIGSNCTIGKGVRIGTGSIVAANSYVNNDIPPFHIFGGVPAKFIKSRLCSKM